MHKCFLIIESAVIKGHRAAVLVWTILVPFTNFISLLTCTKYLKVLLAPLILLVMDYNDCNGLIVAGLGAASQPPVPIMKTKSAAVVTTNTGHRGGGAGQILIYLLRLRQCC